MPTNRINVNKILIFSVKVFYFCAFKSLKNFDVFSYFKEEFIPASVSAFPRSNFMPDKELYGPPSHFNVHRWV